MNAAETALAQTRRKVADFFRVVYEPALDPYIDNILRLKLFEYLKAANQYKEYKALQLNSQLRNRERMRENPLEDDAYVMTENEIQDVGLILTTTEMVDEDIRRIVMYLRKTPQFRAMMAIAKPKPS